MKKKTPRDPVYLDFIRAQDCCTCGRPAPSQAAHVRIRGGGGMGLKPSDYRTVPLCAACHGRQHGLGEKTFWERQGCLPETLIAACLVTYVRDKKGAIAALEELAALQAQEAKA